MGRVFDVAGPYSGFSVFLRVSLLHLVLSRRKELVVFVNISVVIKCAAGFAKSIQQEHSFGYIQIASWVGRKPWNFTVRFQNN